jgi:hypothetical protein
MERQSSADRYGLWGRANVIFIDFPTRPTVEGETFRARGKQALSPSRNNREHFSMKLKTFLKHLLIYFEGEAESFCVKSDF